MNPLELRVRHALDDLRALSRSAKETALTETVRRIHDEQEQFIAHTLRTLATELEELRVTTQARRLARLTPLCSHRARALPPSKGAVCYAAPEAPLCSACPRHSLPGSTSESVNEE